MSLMKFVRSLMPMLPKKNLVDSVSESQKNIKELILPMIERSTSAYESTKFKSAFANKVNVDFSKHRNVKTTGSFLNSLHKCFISIEENENVIMSLLSQKKQDIISTETLMVRDVTIIQYQNVVLHLIEYTSRLLSMFWIAESNVSRGLSERNGILPGEIDYVTKNLSDYLTKLNAVSITRKDLEQSLDGMSDIVFDPDAEDTIFSLTASEKVDPLNFRFIPLSINPWFKISKWHVDRQHEKYEALKLDLQRVEIRARLAEADAKSTADPNAEKLAAAYDRRRIEIQDRLNRMEKV